VKLDLPSGEKALPLVLMAMFVAAAASILLTRQTGVDYLYYYLPISDYLFSRGMPKAVSPSVLDAPFGYPAAEYLLLGATSVFGDGRIWAIKLIQCLKVAAVFWLAFRVASAARAGALLPTALIAPSAVAFFAVYSTDINAIIGMLAILLIVKGVERSFGLWLLVAYAALSKYTFWLFLPPLYLMLWHARALRWPSLIPLLLIALHLGANFHFFGNPVFPVGAQPDPALPADIARYMTVWSKPNVHYGLYIGAGFIAGGGLLALLPGLPKRWFAIAGLYIAGWVVAMQPDTASDTGRFLLPASIGAACLLAPPLAIRRLYLLPYALGLGLALYAFIVVRSETPVYFPLLAAFALAFAFAFAPNPYRLLSYAVVLLTFVGYSAARVYLKFDVSRDLGYSEYRQLIQDVETSADQGIVITDFPRLPHALRFKPNVILWWSDAWGSEPSRMAKTGKFDCAAKPLKLIGSQKFMAVVQQIRFENCSVITTVALP
jgi:hypothetical protein